MPAYPAVGLTTSTFTLQVVLWEEFHSCSGEPRWQREGTLFRGFFTNIVLRSKHWAANRYLAHLIFGLSAGQALRIITITVEKRHPAASYVANSTQREDHDATLARRYGAVTAIGASSQQPNCPSQAGRRAAHRTTLRRWLPGSPLTGGTAWHRQQEHRPAAGNTGAVPPSRTGYRRWRIFCHRLCLEKLSAMPAPFPLPGRPSPRRP
jgi:hypothetical protein